jgi:hypothetical protein
MQCNVTKSITQFCGLLPSIGERKTQKQGKGWGENTPLYIQRGRVAILHFKLLQYITGLDIHT